MKHLQKCRYDVCGAQDVFWMQRTGAKEAGRSQAVDIPGVPCFSGFSLLEAQHPLQGGWTWVSKASQKPWMCRGASGIQTPLTPTFRGSL